MVVNFAFHRIVTFSDFVIVLIGDIAQSIAGLVLDNVCYFSFLYVFRVQGKRIFIESQNSKFV